MENRARAEPHRLDRFTQWSREIIATNKREGGDGTRRNAQIIDTKKGGENDERGNSQTR